MIVLDKLFSNQYFVQIVCGDPVYLLTRLASAGVRMLNVVTVNEWAIQLQVSGKDLHILRQITHTLGCDIKVLAQSGPAAFGSLLKRRLVFVFGIFLLFLLTLFIPTKVLFVEVEGNHTLSTEQILEKAELVGIYFGASRKEVRSEKMKNALLQAVPHLKWAGINTYGCRAVISVTERESADTPQMNRNAVQGIYAMHDGIISSITVTKGTPLCKKGDAIKAGQLLISGYTDCGLLTRAESAQGEVFAITQHKMQAYTPSYPIVRGVLKEKTEQWSIQIGKKKINLYIGSGNSTTGCGKIVKRYTLTLPGDFALPISLVRNTVFPYETTGEYEAADPKAVCGLAESYIEDNMVSGRVLDAYVSFETGEQMHLFTGTYTCEEMIGKIQNEGIE